MTKRYLTEPPILDETGSFAWLDWFKTLYTAVATPPFKTKVGIPTTTDILNGNWAVYKDSSGGSIKLYANDGGTIKSVTLT